MSKTTFVTIAVNSRNNFTENRVYALPGIFTKKELSNTFTNPNSKFFDSVVLDNEKDGDNYRFAPAFSTSSTIEFLQEKYI